MSEPPNCLDVGIGDFSANNQILSYLRPPRREQSIVEYTVGERVEVGDMEMVEMAGE